MIKEFKIFELFDTSYDYKLINNKRVSDEIGEGKEYLYKFIAKDGTNYFVRPSFYKSPEEEEDYDNFLSIDFMDEEQYEVEKENIYDINFKNTKKHDSIKIITTVFNILVGLEKELNPYIISFNCTKDRYKTYVYCVNKFLTNYIKVYYEGDNNMCYFYLYNNKYYKVSEDGDDVIRIDNKKIVYSSK